MNEDPLARLKRLQSGAASASPVAPAPAGVAEAAGDDYEYKAFKPQGKPMYLGLRRKGDMERELLYGGLIDMGHDGKKGTIIILVFSFNVKVTIKGRNLQALMTGLRLHDVEYIQEFDPAQWEKPKDDSAPFVESIKIEVKPAKDATADAEQIAV